MNRTSSAAFLLGLLLLLALMIRLPGISYGLPYHVIGDEETNVYGVLLMLEHHTLPVFDEKDFTILYEPPLLACVYAVVFIPTIAVAYLASGAHGFSHFISLLTLDPSLLWYVARTLGVLFSLVSIYLVYDIGRVLFKHTTPALFAALLFATSFLATTIAPTAKHWNPGIACSLLALLLVLTAYDATAKRRTCLLIGAGAALGLSFGFSFLPLYLPLVAALIIYFSYHRENFKKTLVEVLQGGLSAGTPFVLLALGVIALHPYSFSRQIIHGPGTLGAASASWASFFIFYGTVLWSLETPILVCSMVGVLMLLWKRAYKLLFIFGVFFAGVIVPMHLFLFEIGRYLVPLLPMCALLGGYGVYELVQLLPFANKKISLIFLLGMLVLYAGAVFGRYEVLLVQGDTRVQAAQWIAANIPAGSTILINSQSLHLEGTQASLALQQSISTLSLRAPDRVLLANPSLAAHPYTLFTLNTTPVDQQAALVQAALKEPAPRYYVEDAWASTSVDALIPAKVTLQTFTSTNEAGLEGLSAGGDTEVTPMQVLGLLYGAKSFGPTVTIYKLK